MSFGDRIKHAWNAFSKESEETQFNYQEYGTSYGGLRPDRTRLSNSNERSIISSIYTRLGIDTASINIRHVRVDQNGRYTGEVRSGLNDCLTIEANIDQAARAFRQDIAMTLFDKGTVAIVPIVTSMNPKNTASFDITDMRVGEIVEWMPRHVKVRVYNERTGLKEDIVVSKRLAAIVENPLYSVMNEPNSTLQRLIRKLNMLDSADEQASSGKLDLIIQLPYVIKSEARRQQAEMRRKDIEDQLKGSKYGIAYTDGTEKITQLNRPTENNLLIQIEYLTKMLYGQLGLTAEIFDGTADEKAMLNYHNRTIEPVLAAMTQAMKRTFLTKTARTQGQSIEFFKEPFKLVPVSQLAEIADKFTRNEVLSSNEVRAIIGFKPADDPKAEELRNKNLPMQFGPDGIEGTPDDVVDEAGASEEEETSITNSALDEVDSAINGIFAELGLDPDDE